MWKCWNRRSMRGSFTASTWTWWPMSAMRPLSTSSMATEIPSTTWVCSPTATLINFLSFFASLSPQSRTSQLQSFQEALDRLLLSTGMSSKILTIAIEMGRLWRTWSSYRAQWADTEAACFRRAIFFLVWAMLITKADSMKTSRRSWDRETDFFTLSKA